MGSWETGPSHGPTAGQGFFPDLISVISSTTARATEAATQVRQAIFGAEERVPATPAGSSQSPILPSQLFGLDPMMLLWLGLGGLLLFSALRR